MSSVVKFLCKSLAVVVLAFAVILGFTVYACQRLYIPEMLDALLGFSVRAIDWACEQWDIKVDNAG